MNFIGIRRKEIKLNQAITEWLKGDHSERQIVLMISLMVGVCTGLTAFVLKSLIEEIKHLLTSGFAVEDMNLLYLVFPAVGILLAMLFVTYIVRGDISHGVTKILYAMSRGRSRIKSHNRWSSIIASAITIATITTRTFLIAIPPPIPLPSNRISRKSSRNRRRTRNRTSPSDPPPSC